MNLFDSHLRLADPRFPPAELPAIVAQARGAGVAGGLVTGTSLEASRRAVQAAERFAGEWDLWAAVGAHPAAAASIHEETITALHRMGQARRVRAISAGLDLTPGNPPRRVQEAALEALLQLAGWLDLPVTLQAGAGAGPRLLERLRAHRDLFPGGVLHDFNGTADALGAVIALDLSVGVSGRVTDRQAGALIRAVLPTIPAERLLIETDAPDQPPKPHHRETDRSEPAFLPDVLKEVAHLRHTRAEPLGETVSDNARRLFRLGRE